MHANRYYIFKNKIISPILIFPDFLGELLQNIHNIRGITLYMQLDIIYLKLKLSMFHTIFNQIFVFLGDFLKIPKINRKNKQKKTEGLGTKPSESPPQAKNLGVIPRMLCMC